MMMMMYNTYEYADDHDGGQMQYCMNMIIIILVMMMYDNDYNYDNCGIQPKQLYHIIIFRFLDLGAPQCNIYYSKAKSVYESNQFIDTDKH